MKICDIEKLIEEDFSFLENTDDKYVYIIELGKELQPLPKEAYTDDNLIKGCQSNVWMIAEKKGDLLYFYADSDALLVKGIVALLLKTLSGQTPKDIVENDVKVLEKIGLQALLSMNRANGLKAMIRQIKTFALAMGGEL